MLPKHSGHPFSKSTCNTYRCALSLVMRVWCGAPLELLTNVYNLGWLLLQHRPRTCMVMVDESKRQISVYLYILVNLHFFRGKSCLVICKIKVLRYSGNAALLKQGVFQHLYRLSGRCLAVPAQSPAAQVLPVCWQLVLFAELWWGSSCLLHSLLWVGWPRLVRTVEWATVTSKWVKSIPLSPLSTW